MNQGNANRYIDFGQVSRDELERARRELTAGIGLLRSDSPARPLIAAQIIAVDNELAKRPASKEIDGSAARTKQEDSALIAALAGEYQDEWKVWKPGNYVADHRTNDVSLVSTSLEGLAEKLRTFTELIKDLPW